MELMEIYNQIHNPIDDPRVIEKLINAYANLSKGFGGYYGQLTKTVQKEHNKGQYYREDADRFYAILFNKWKNSIVAMTRDEFVQLYRKGSYGQDFIKMRNYLKNVPDVSTMKEADEIFYGNKGDKELESALDKYSWKSFGGESGWIHVCSRYLTAKKDQYPNVEHRLYLDTESLDTYKMITYLVEKCDEHHLPYYFKFDQYANRDDTIVIYSSTENLTKYVEILQEIKKEHPDLVSRAKEPPVLTGQIDGWIGYGSEPSKTPDGKRQSFNEVRAKTLEYSIGTVTKQWIMSHRNQEITYQDQKLSFQDYVAMKSAEKLVADLEKRFLYYEEKDKKVAQRNGKTYNQLTVIDRLGYALQDVRSSQFKQGVYRILKDHMGTLLPRICNGSYKDMDTINMNVRNGKKITFSGDDLETIIQRLSVNIAKNDPNFIPTVQATIKKEASQYGIDSEKFCFDTKTREKMRTITAQKEAQRQQQVQQQPPVSNTPQQTVLTNGAADPNKYLGASGENYEVMKNKIKSLGSMKEILKNHDLVKSIIAYNGDRHFFTAFIDLVNEGLAKHEIWDDDLEVFTSGEVADAIVNIDQTARQYGNRQAYPNETLDKLNYLALITDSKAYAASFTHPEILQAMAGNGNRELREWSQSSHVPPVGGFAAVVSELLEAGNLEAAKEYIQTMGYYPLKYVTDNKQNGFSLANNNGKGKLLTNGAADPNKYLGVSGENYEVMKNKIKSLGSMKEILKNHDLVKSIIAYNGDRHFFTAFIDLVNEGLAKHEIWDDDLEVFTSGEVADAIVNIDQTARQYGNRQAYPNETLDKLNYLALITDSKAYAASFTHPEILQAMAGNGNRELREWSQSSHVPPVGGFAAVVYEMIEKGNIEEAKEFIDRIGYHSKKYSQAHKMQPTEEIKQENIQEEVMKQTVNVEDTKSVDLSSLDVQTLPQMINPALMERKMKLPNGAEIPAKQYIQEVVYPQLPKNGVVILDNGAVLPVKQFIEEGVMFECQEKYNGDFPKYMAERTRSNLGVVTVGNGDERYDLNPVEITEYINPALLDKRVKLPNGVEISARQYIQEVYAPHIPANGMVTLSNGAEIPVKQYIEEVLLWEGQEKYNGDIEQILYNTTRNNTGIVNADPKNLQEALIKMRTQTESIEQQQSVGGHGR